ncbi:MAG: hypothetical protein ACFB0B_14385 [Thermonemataceae bacterium]
MSKKLNIDALFKQRLTDKEAPFQEADWEALFEELEGKQLTDGQFPEGTNEVADTTSQLLEGGSQLVNNTAASLWTKASLLITKVAVVASVATLPATNNLTKTTEAIQPVIEVKSTKPTQNDISISADSLSAEPVTTTDTEQPLPNQPIETSGEVVPYQSTLPEPVSIVKDSLSETSGKRQEEIKTLPALKEQLPTQTTLSELQKLPIATEEGGEDKEKKLKQKNKKVYEEPEVLFGNKKRKKKENNP